MMYDIQIGNSIRRGIPYAELIALPIESDTFIRRQNGDWIQAKDCIELTHVLAQQPISPSINHDNEYQDPTDDYIEDDYEEEYDTEDFYETEEEEETEQQYAPSCIINTPYFQEPPSFHYTPNIQVPNNVQPSYQPREIRNERIFVPTAEYFKCKQKRKAAIIGVCTLGLAGLSLMGVGNTWRSNIFAGTSFSANAGLGFVLKCLSFCLMTALIAIPYFIYSVLALIYYSIRLNNLKH